MIWGEGVVVHHPGYVSGGPEAGALLDDVKVSAKEASAWACAVFLRVFRPEPDEVGAREDMVHGQLLVVYVGVLARGN